MAEVSPSRRFRELRERAGLSPDDAAKQMGLQPAAVWDIESHEGDLTCCYSPSDMRRFCAVMGARPSELFDVTTTEPAVSTRELVELIHTECRKREIQLEKFEDAVGWR